MPAALDQAVGLRRMLKCAGVRVLPVFGTAARVPAVVNLASALAREGSQVLVLDASRGEVAPAFGLTARYELKHVLDGDVALAQAALHTRDEVRVLPAARGMRMLSEARVSGLDFFESLAQKVAPLDLIIVNCDAGERALRLLPVQGEAMLVLERGPQVVTEGVRCLAALAAQQATSHCRVFLMHTAFDEARAIVGMLARLAYDKFGIELTAGGSAPPDRRLWEAARARRTLFDIDPWGPAARAFHNAAAGITDWELTVVATQAAAAQPPRPVTKLH
jgi:flagellar biosynthesis protein FlhG